MSTDPVIDAHQVADEIGQHYKTVLRHIRAGRIRATKRGNRWFIRRSAIDEFLGSESEAA